MSDDSIESSIRQDIGKDSVESRIRQEVGNDVDIHDTKDPDEIYVTNPSKMKLVLQDFEKAIQAKSRIINPIVLGVTTLSVLFVSDFNSMFGLSPEVWESFFVITTFGCIIWILISAYRIYKYRGKTDPEYVVEELKSSE
ncbi:hypothetical protein [Natrinema sp. H-ect4]|uniref:hypothetical protein n=1 Tax=Natrinema sp. H-ect4 TaxID=3242699 RepID=UPI0035A9A1A9